MGEGARRDKTEDKDPGDGIRKPEIICFSPLKCACSVLP